MRTTAQMLRVVSSASPAEGPAAAGAAPSSADLRLVAFLLAVALVPIVGAAAGGRFSPGVVGLATAGALVAGRQLAHDLGAWLRARR